MTAYTLAERQVCRQRRCGCVRQWQTDSIGQAQSDPLLHMRGGDILPCDVAHSAIIVHTEQHSSRRGCGSFDQQAAAATAKIHERVIIMRLRQ
jgi:hypothetical protein